MMLGPRVHHTPFVHAAPRPSEAPDRPVSGTASAIPGTGGCDAARHGLVRLVPVHGIGARRRGELSPLRSRPRRVIRPFTRHTGAKAV